MKATEGHYTAVSNLFLGMSYYYLNIPCPFTELVNSNYVLLGLNDLKRNKEKFFEMFYRHCSPEDEMFIRPSNGYKTFTGQLLPRNN